MLVRLPFSPLTLFPTCDVHYVGIVLYGYALAYLVAPDIFDSTHVVAFIGGLPEYVKYAGKVILAGPFAFHSFNGLRHLAWDSGKCESIALNLTISCSEPLL